jgi:hypothetical protein
VSDDGSGPENRRARKRLVGPSPTLSAGHDPAGRRGLPDKQVSRGSIPRWPTGAPRTCSVGGSGSTHPALNRETAGSSPARSTPSSRLAAGAEAPAGGCRGTGPHRLTARIPLLQGGGDGSAPSGAASAESPSWGRHRPHKPAMRGFEPRLRNGPSVAPRHSLVAQWQSARPLTG